MKNFFQNKKQILIIIGVILFALLLGFAYFAERQKTPDDSQTTQKANVPKVAKTTPSNNAKDIRLDAAIKIELTEDLDVLAQKDIGFAFTPDVETIKEWTSPKELTIYPKVLFKEETNYKVDVYSSGQPIYQFFFKTKFIADVGQEEGLEYQGQLDYDAGQKQKAYYESKPFLEKLPIETESYGIAYASKTNSILVRFYANFDQATIDRLKPDIINKLKEIGVPDSIKVEWITKK